jgi:DNA replication protein DnaC
MRRLEELLRATSGADASTRQKDTPSVPEPPPDEDACPLCGGAGFVRPNVPLGHPDFGRAVPCQCVEQEGEEGRLARLQRYSNLGPLTRLTFDNLITRGRSSRPSDQERFSRCVEDARAFTERPEGWLILCGTSGCGKTHIAAALANRCLERGWPALFMVVPDLLDHLRAAYQPSSEVGYDRLFEQVRNAPLLILDDLGTQSATPWAQEKLFQLINHRFNARLPTVVTTNVPLSQMDERLCTRLTDPSLARVYQLEERKSLEHQDLNLLDAPRVREMTFESFGVEDLSLSPRDQRLRENAYRAALEFAQDPQRWLILIGEADIVKTHLAAAIANHRRAQGESPLLVMVAELLDLLRYTQDPGSPVSYHDIFQQVRETPLLILDDLEIGTGSDWTRERLLRLLKSRYLERLATVITTPHPLNKLRSDSGWERLASLLADDAAFCSVVPVGEPAAQAEPTVDLRRARRGTRVRKPSTRM